MAFNLPGKISDPDRNQQSAGHAPARGTTVQVAINFALKEKLNLLLLSNDSDLMLEPGIWCRAAAPGRGCTEIQGCPKHSPGPAQREALPELGRKRTLGPPLPLSSPPGVCGTVLGACCSRRWLHWLGCARAEEMLRWTRCCVPDPTLLSWDFCPGTLPTGQEFISKSYPMKMLSWLSAVYLVCDTAPP